MDAASAIEPRFMADTIPAGIPITMAISMAENASSHACRQARGQFGGDGIAGVNGPTEITVEETPHVPEVLVWERFIQAQSGAQFGNLPGGRIVPCHDGGRIPRDQMNEGEHDHRDPEHDRQERCQTPEDKLGHSAIRCVRQGAQRRPLCPLPADC